jgi:hypothetical protein
MKKAVVAIAAGCGGGGGGLGKEEYVSKLNAICADVTQKREEIGDLQGLADVVEKGPRLLDAFDMAIDQVKNLGDPPGEIAGQVDRFIELSEERRDLIEQTIDAARDGDTAKISELSSKTDPLDSESDDIAKELGASDCAAD